VGFVCAPADVVSKLARNTNVAFLTILRLI